MLIEFNLCYIRPTQSIAWLCAAGTNSPAPQICSPGVSTQRPLDYASAEAIAAAALAVNGGDPAAALVDLLRMYLSTTVPQSMAAAAIAC